MEVATVAVGVATVAVGVATVAVGVATVVASSSSSRNAKNGNGRCNGRDNGSSKVALHYYTTYHL